MKHLFAFTFQRFLTSDTRFFFIYATPLNVGKLLIDLLKVTAASLKRSQMIRYPWKVIQNMV